MGAAHNLGSLATLTPRFDTFDLALCFRGLRNLSIRIERTGTGADKEVLAWVAPELDYMLVRLWRGEDNVEQFDVQLHKLDFTAPEPQTAN